MAVERDRDRLIARGDAELAVDAPQLRLHGVHRHVELGRDRVVRALAAMLAHARKFRSAGAVSFRAAITESGKVCFEVVYRGAAAHAAGMPGAVELYHPVESLDSEVLAGVGVGLGLHRLVAEAQDGSLNIHAEPSGEVKLLLNMPIDGKMPAAKR